MKINYNPPASRQHKKHSESKFSRLSRKKTNFQNKKTLIKKHGRGEKDKGIRKGQTRTKG